MRALILLGVLVTLLLGQRLLLGEGSYADLAQLGRQEIHQEADLAALRQRNTALAAEVEDLRTGVSAIEERARADLGMIRPGEVYYRVLDAGH